MFWRACKGSVGVGHDAARDRVGEPQAAALVGGETFGPLADRLDVTSADPAVGANRCVGQKTSFTQVDDVLARRIQELCCFACGELLVPIDGCRSVDDGLPHDITIRTKHKKHN